MSEASRGNWETAVMLPLGVALNQLARVESQLRLVNIRAVDLTDTHDGGRLGGLVGAKLEQIDDALEAIRCLIAELHDGMRPRGRASRED